MKTAVRITVGIGTSLALLFSAHSAEYFVSKAGDDANDGMATETAFATVQKGVDALRPGDTLTIMPGEYHGSVRRDKLGGADKGTVIRAQIPGTALLRGDVRAPAFRRSGNCRFTWVADVDLPAEAQAVNELDTGVIFKLMPNATELEFVPGKFYHDVKARKLYLSTSDMEPPSQHVYTASVVPTHGLHLSNPKRVILEGLGFTGFNAAKQSPRRDGAEYSTWGLFLLEGKGCVVRDCVAYLNGQGIGMRSRLPTSGDNAIDRCVAWSNASTYGTGDRGGLTLFEPRRDTIRDSVAFLNGDYGINIRSGGREGRKKENQSRLTRNLAWGNGRADCKIKTGYRNVHVTERCVAEKPSNALNPTQCLFREPLRFPAPGSIILKNEKALDPLAEFADPVNRDYRLQATSRFRGSAPGGGDRGPFPYRADVFYARPNGDDGADGLSVKKAWKALARAARDLKPGDTLYLLPGTYAAGPDLRLQGTGDKPIAIRGRGVGKVEIQGGLRLTNSAHVEFRRLGFRGDVGLRRSANVTFRNCDFAGKTTALDANGVSGLTLRHCRFAGFRRAALAFANCARVDLRGNGFENEHGVAVRLDNRDALRYAGHNGYRKTGAALEVAGKLLSLEEAKGLLRRPCRLDDPAGRLAGGPFGRPCGPCRDEPPEREMRLVRGPRVHSVSATTANLEWITSLPATCKLAWGQTPDCANKDTFDVDHFGSYSLTGLKPGRTYYFRVKSLRGARDLRRRPVVPGVAPATVKGAPLAFTTLEQDPAPRTLYVAPDGDDANSGLSGAKAFRTLQQAANQARPGDTVLIGAGTYRERVRVRATGEAGAPITFKCLPGARVVLSGAGKKLNKAFVAAGKRHLRFDGMYFVESNRERLQGWILRYAGNFSLYRCGDIRITRCFAEGRGG